jgi:hypothetical protein
MSAFVSHVRISAEALRSETVALSDETLRSSFEKNSYDICLDEAQHQEMKQKDLKNFIDQFLVGSLIDD